MVTINLDIFIPAEQRSNPTIAHVKQWIDKVNLLNLPDDYPLYSLELGLSVSLHESQLSSILCGDCSPQHDHSDLLITTHPCSSSKTLP